MDKKIAKPSEAYSTIHYRIPFDHMLEGCQIISRDYRYLYVNDVAAKHGKKTRDELLGKTMAECYPGIEKTKMFTYLKECIERGKHHNMENEFRFQNGTKGWFELRMEPLPEGAIILSVDISERKRSEEHMKRLEELKSTFMMIVSHQLRTPLSVVRGSLEGLRGFDGGVEDEATRDDLIAAAHAATIEIINRVDDVLDALAAEADRHIITKKPVSLEKLWQPIYEEYRGRAKAKQTPFIYTPPAKQLPTVNGDPKRISAVLESLAQNAITYTPEKNGSIEAEISQRGKSIRFTIRDEGIGIPEDEQKRVFNRFFRGSNAQQATPDATGLSLAVAKYYIRKHNGKIGFSSEQDKGSTFWFEIPID